MRRSRNTTRTKDGNRARTKATIAAVAQLACSVSPPQFCSYTTVRRHATELCQHSFSNTCVLWTLLNHQISLIELALRTYKVSRGTIRSSTQSHNSYSTCRGTLPHIHHCTTMRTCHATPSPIYMYRIGITRTCHGTLSPIHRSTTYVRVARLGHASKVNHTCYTKYSCYTDCSLLHTIEVALSAPTVSA